MFSKESSGSASRYFLCFVLFHTAFKVHGYKPVIIMHGLFDEASSLKQLETFIDKAHPGTKIYSIDLYDNYGSLSPLWTQLKAIRNVTEKIMKSSKEGVHFIGFSQGGLVVRGIAQTVDDHNIHNFIALSSPLNGQYGDTYYVNKIFPGHLKEDMYEIFYSRLGQQCSIGNYWKDPHHEKYYSEYSEYLALLNNETNRADFQYPSSWRSNFARLENVVLIGGPDDGVITPWQSAQFGCYDENDKVVPFRSLKIYQKDVFGLRSLDKANKLHEYTVSGVQHTHWHLNETVFLKCIEPWLT